MTVLMVLIAAAYSVPFHVYPYTSFFNEWLGLFAVFVALTELTKAPALASEHSPTQQIVKPSSMAVVVPWLALLPLALAVVIGIHAASGMMTYAWDALMPVSYLLCLTIAMSVGASIAARPLGAYALVRAVAYGHVLAGLLSVLIASQQWLANETQWGDWVMHMTHGSAIRPYANTGQPNQLALLFCLALAALWWSYQTRLLRVLWASVAVVLLLWGLALTQSRIGWLIVPAVALCIGLWRANSALRPVSLWWLAAMVAVYIAFVLLLPALSEVLALDTVRSLMERVGQTADRRVLFAQALRIGLEHFWEGAGWHEFAYQQQVVSADFVASNYADHAHNLVLNSAAELGWPITLAFCGALAWWGYRVFLQQGLGRRLSSEVGFAALCFIAVGIHSMVEFPLWYGYVLMPVGLLLGVVHQQQWRGCRVITVPRGLGWLLALLMAVGLVGVATQHQQTITSHRLFEWELAGLKTDEGSFERPAFTLFPQFYDYYQFTQTGVSDRMAPEEIAWMARVAKRFGFAQVLMRMSLVYALNNRPDDAVKSLVILMKLHAGYYPQTYREWQKLATTEPDKYAVVFKQLPPPVQPSQP